MTRKKAIKTIMSVTGHGDKRAANKAFDNVKKCLAGNPRNADVCYRVICFIYNAANSDPDGPDVHAYKTLTRAWVSAKLLRLRYGSRIGGTLIGDAEA